MKATTSQQNSGKKSQSSTTKSKPNSVRLTAQQTAAFMAGEGLFLEDHQGDVIGFANPAPAPQKTPVKALDLLSDVDSQLEFLSVLLGCMDDRQDFTVQARVGFALTLDDIQRKVRTLLH